MKLKIISYITLIVLLSAIVLPSTVLAAPISGADVDLTKFFIDSLDDTPDTISSTPADVDWPGVGGSTLYFGSTGKFSRIYFYLSSESVSDAWTISEAGSPDGFEYFNGSTWVGINVTNVTGAWNSTGIHYFSFTPPADWATETVNESNNYYLRVMCDIGCNTMMETFSIDQISLLSAGGAPATPEFSTYVLLVTISLAGLMAFKQTKSFQTAQ